MYQKLSFIFSKKRRRILSIISKMLCDSYSVREVEKILRAVRSAKLKESDILELQENLIKGCAHNGEGEHAITNYNEVVRLLDEEYGHTRTKEEHVCLDRGGNPIPWYTYSAIEYVKQLDFSDCDVFEFGSGYSSLFWAERARRVVSVEHEPEWYSRIMPEIPSNLEYLLVTEPLKYASKILDYQRQFDVIIIDGEQRPECVAPALSKLSDDGLIIVDNSDWFPGICSLLRKADLIQIDMQGLGPINSYAWTTSFFLRRTASFQPLTARQPLHGPGSIPNMCDLPIDPRIDKPSLNGLDDKLAKYLDFRNGFFVEAGSNDGFNQSNTYYLENSMGWRGLLIEGIPELSKICRMVRARSLVCNAALVADEKATPEVTMRFANLMSLVKGSMANQEIADEHIRKGVEIQELAETYEVKVRGRTLTSLCVDLIPDQTIDFLSLDVEGYELEVLKGLDLEKVAPKFVLVETYALDAVVDLIGSRYDLVEKLTIHDYLFKLRKLSESVPEEFGSFNKKLNP
jgi:FkbM family methyltransferase